MSWIAVALERQDFSLVVLREASIFLPQCCQARVPLDRTEAEPGEIVPDLKIEEILRGKLPRQLVEILSMDVGATLDEQFMIARKGTDHGRPIGRIEMADEKCLFGSAPGLPPVVAHTPRRDR